MTTVHEGNVVGFAVRDNGCGMSEEFIAKISVQALPDDKEEGARHRSFSQQADRGSSPRRS